MNQLQAIKEIIARGKTFLGTPYVMGGTDPGVALDCRGFVRKAYGEFKQCIGGALGNVREFKASAIQRGFWSETGGRGWPVVYGHTDPALGKGPDHIGHIAIQLQPVSRRFPKGKAMSARNPNLDTVEHNLILPGMIILGYIKPDWSQYTPDPEPPITDPEPPV